MYLALADAYGQMVGTSDSQKLQISIKSTSTTSSSGTGNYAAALTGTTSFYSENGVYNLSGIKFTASPGYSYSLSFTSEGIDNTKPANKEYIKQTQSSSGSSNADTSIDFEALIQLRDCEIGESFTTSGS